MLLSFYMPHSGRDEEDYIETLETVRNIMTKGRMAGAVDFLSVAISTLRLGLAMLTRLQELDSIECMRCEGGGEDVITCEKMRWLQLLEEFNCTVTSTYLGSQETIISWDFVSCALRRGISAYLGPFSFGSKHRGERPACEEGG